MKNTHDDLTVCVYEREKVMLLLYYEERGLTKVCHESTGRPFSLSLFSFEFLTSSVNGPAIHSTVEVCEELRRSGLGLVPSKASSRRRPSVVVFFSPPTVLEGDKCNFGNLNRLWL